jgi:hypothetical protein
MTSKFARIVMPLLAAAVVAAAQTNAWELGHPDAKLLLGIDLKSLRESAVGQSFRSQRAALSPPMGPAGMAFGFLEQIDRIFISSPAMSSPAVSLRAGKAGSPAASPKENPPFLLVVEGTMPIQQLLAFLPGTAHRYHMVDVYRGAKATDASIATLDARTILIGDEKSVLAAIDRRGRGAPPASATLARARQLASTHDVWMLASDDLSKFQPANTSFASPLAGQIKGVEVGLAVRDGFQFEMSLAAENDAVAAQLVQLLSEKISLAQAQNPETAEAARKLQIGTEGNRMRVSLALTKEEFEQNLRAFQATRLAAATASARPAAPPQPQTAAPPGKIRIYGLDEGVREIQMTH